MADNVNIIHEKTGQPEKTSIKTALSKQVNLFTDLAFEGELAKAQKKHITQTTREVASFDKYGAAMDSSQNSSLSGISFFFLRFLPSAFSNYVDVFVWLAVRSYCNYIVQSTGWAGGWCVAKLLVLAFSFRILILIAIILVILILDTSLASYRTTTEQYCLAAAARRPVVK